MFNFYQLAENFVLKNLEHLNFGQLQLENHDGKTYSFGKNSENLKADLKINSKNFYFNLIKGGSSALAESYVNNDFSTKNLTALIELSAKNLDITNRFTGLFNKLNIFHFLKRFFTSNNKTKSVEYISKHYDLGNDFFSIWLDKTLTYSCAIYNDNNEQLDIAQINKYNKLIDLIKPKAGSKILEIGCGWGGFAEHLAKNNDIKLDCITISKKQLEFAKERIFKAGLNEKVNIKFLDYRDVREKYDSIASIEMIEAVGEKNLKTYFSTISKNLNQGGVAAIQAIIIQDKLYDSYRKNQDFIQKYIFPGGFLPSFGAIKNHVSKNGLELAEHNSYGLHYSKTLKEWRENFIKSWDLISQQGFQNSFKKIWDFYFSYCEAGFNAKNIDLIQFSAVKK
ncbi:MAG: class I SAM-dependent methyltransferase [Pelagibacteraceae bacterium]